MRSLTVIFFFLTTGITFSQGTVPARKIKSLTDSVFVPGDIIRPLPMILFMPDKYDLGHPSNPKDSIKLIADFMKKHKNLTFELSNHTDYRQREEYSYRLSFRRAKTIVTALIEDFGIDPQRIVPAGYEGILPRMTDKVITTPSGKTIPVGTVLTEKWIDANVPKTKNKDDYEFIMQMNRRSELRVLSDDFGVKNVKGTYSGWWATTQWVFEFFMDSTYKRTSSGHYGSTVVNGKYRVSNDTIYILSGHENTSGTVNEKYLIDGDSCIIDIDLKYDYCKSVPGKFVENGITYDEWKTRPKRNIMYPQVPAKTAEDVKALENVLQQVINCPKFNKSFPADTSASAAPLVIESYFEVRAYNSIHLLWMGRPVVFKTEAEILKENIKSFIRFTEINVASDYLSINMDHEGKGVTAHIYFSKFTPDGPWVMAEERSTVFER